MGQHVRRHSVMALTGSRRVCRTECALQEFSKRLLVEANILDDFLEKRSADITHMHWHGGYDVTGARISKIPMTPFLVDGNEPVTFERLGNFFRRARREAPAHIVAGTCTINPRETSAAGLSPLGMFLPASERASR